MGGVFAVRGMGESVCLVYGVLLLLGMGNLKLCMFRSMHGLVSQRAWAHQTA